MKKPLWALIVAMLMCTSCATVKKNDKSISIGNRIKYNFNPDWKFIKENPNNAKVVNYDDATWSTVSAPHTFNDVDTFLPFCSNIFVP